MKTFSLLAIAMLLPVSAAHAADTTGTTPRFAVNAGYASASQHGDTVVPVTLDNSWPAGTDVENSDDAGAATFGFSWYVRPNVAIELWGAGSADNDVEIDVENGPDVNVASYRTRPLALSVQYHFNGLFSGVGERVTPFVGLGWHRTTVSSVKGEAAGYAGLDIDDGNGLAATLGVDVALGQRWFVRGDVRYLRWDTESRIGNTVLAKADLDTVTYGASLGLRF